MRRLNILIILSLYFLPNHANGQYIDSLISVTQDISLPASTRIKAAYNIPWSQFPHPPDSGISILVKTLPLAKKEKNYLYVAKFHEGLGVLNMIKGNYQEAQNQYIKGLDVIQKQKCNCTKLEFQLNDRLSNHAGTIGNIAKQREWIYKTINDPRIDSFKLSKAYALAGLGNYYYGRDSFTNAIEEVHRSLHLARSEKIEILIPHLEEKLGMYYSNQGNEDSGFYWYKQALKRLQEKNNITGIASVAYNFALAYYHAYQYDSTLKFVEIARTNFKKASNVMGQVLSFELIASVYSKNNKDEKAIAYFKESIEVLNEYKANYYLPKAFNMLGQCYFKLKDYNNAETSFLKALKMAKKNNSNKDMAFSSVHLSEIYRVTSNLPKSKEHINFALELKKTSQSSHVKQVVLFEYAEYLNNTRSFALSNKYLDSTCAFNPSLPLSVKIAQVRSENYTALGDYQNALKARTLENLLLDSMQRQSNKETEKIILAKFRVENAENKAMLAEKEKEIFESKASKQRILSYFGFSLLIISMISIVLIRSRHKKYIAEKEKSNQMEIEAALQAVQHSKEALENQKNLIMDKNRIIKDLKNSIQSKFDTEEEMETFFDEVLTQKILTKSDWNQFQNAFTLMYPSFIIELKKAFEQITEGEIRLFCLTKLGLSRKEIGDMLGVLPKSVHRNQIRFEKKYNTTLDEVLSKIKG